MTLDQFRDKFLSLTDREREAYSVLLEYEKKEAVSLAISITKRSAESYISAILKKFNVKTIEELKQVTPSSFIDKAKQGKILVHSDIDDIYSAANAVSFGNDFIHFEVRDMIQFTQLVKKLNNEGVIMIDTLHERELKRLSLIHNKNREKPLATNPTEEKKEIAFLPIGNM